MDSLSLLRALARRRAAVGALAMLAAAGAANAQAIGNGEAADYPPPQRASAVDATVAAAAAGGALGGAPAVGPAGAVGAEPEYLVRGDALVPNPAHRPPAAGPSRAEVRDAALRGRGAGPLPAPYQGG